MECSLIKAYWKYLMGSTVANSITGNLFLGKDNQLQQFPCKLHINEHVHTHNEPAHVHTCIPDSRKASKLML